MVEINLLPWRAHKMRYEKNIFCKCVIGICLLVGVQFLITYWCLWFKLDAEQARLQQVQKEALQYASLQLRMQNQTLQDASFLNVKQLEAYQSQTLSLLEMAGVKPDTRVCFSHLRRDKERIIIAGETASALDLTNFLRHWQTAQHFSSLKVLQLKPINGSEVMRFRLLIADTLSLL